MSTWAQMTPKEREDHLAKMRAAKKKNSKAKVGETVLSKADQNNGNGGHPTLLRIAELMQLDWKTLTQVQIRELLPILQEAVTKGQQALRAAQNNEGGNLCSVCKKPFVNDRFFGQEQWHDHLTGGIAVLRSCSPVCQAKIEQMANEIKKQTLEREHTRFNRR